MSFKVIETQEAFDEAIKERLAREARKYEGYTSPEKLKEIEDGYKAQIKDQKDYEGYKSPDEVKKIEDDYKTQIDSLKTNELRIKVAHDNGVPFEMASRLQGTTEEELTADAKALSKAFGGGSWPNPQPEKPIDAKRGVQQEVEALVNSLHED